MKLNCKCGQKDDHYVADVKMNLSYSVDGKAVAIEFDYLKHADMEVLAAPRYYCGVCGKEVFDEDN